MNTRAATATARCAADYDALLSALAHARARVLREYRARSRAYDKWLDDKAEEADTVSKQLAAVSAMCAAHSMHASALLHCVCHMSMLAQSLKMPSLAGCFTRRSHRGDRARMMTSCVHCLLSK